MTRGWCALWLSLVGGACEGETLIVGVRPDAGEREGEEIERADGGGGRLPICTKPRCAGDPKCEWDPCRKCREHEDCESSEFCNRHGVCWPREPRSDDKEPSPERERDPVVRDAGAPVDGGSGGRRGGARDEEELEPGPSGSTEKPAGGRDGGSLLDAGTRGRRPKYDAGADASSERQAEAIDEDAAAPER